MHPWLFLSATDPRFSSIANPWRKHHERQCIRKYNRRRLLSEMLKVRQVEIYDAKQR